MAVGGRSPHARGARDRQRLRPAEDVWRAESRRGSSRRTAHDERRRRISHDWRTSARGRRPRPRRSGGRALWSSRLHRRISRDRRTSERVGRPRPRRSGGRALRSRDEECTVPEKKSHDETKEGPQCRFHGVSEVLETVRISFVAMKRIPSLSSQFHAKN